MRLYGLYDDKWFLVADTKETKTGKEYLMISPLWWQPDVWIHESEIEEFKNDEYDSKYV